MSLFRSRFGLKNSQSPCFWFVGPAMGVLLFAPRFSLAGYGSLYASQALSLSLRAFIKSRILWLVLMAVWVTSRSR